MTAGTSLSNNSSAPNADLIGIYDLLPSTIAPIAGIISALALLLNDTSAGFVETIAGQISVKAPLIGHAHPGCVD